MLVSATDGAGEAAAEFAEIAFEVVDTLFEFFDTTPKRRKTRRIEESTSHPPEHDVSTM
jgi:hypothetical protein